MRFTVGVKRELRFLAAFFLVSSLLLTGCSGVYTEEDKVKKLIAKYVSAIIPAYREGKFGDLAKVASQEVLSKIDNTYSAYKNGQGIILDSMLLEMSFDSVVLGSGEDEPTIKVVYFEEEKTWKELYVATETVVQTKELWKYRWVNIKTLEPASSEYSTRYTMEYKVDYRGDSLKVLEVTILNEEILETIETGASWGNNANKPMRVH